MRHRPRRRHLAATLIVPLLLATGANASPASAATPTVADRLTPGQQLARGQAIRSTNGKYVLKLQSDGNLVLRAPAGVSLWARPGPSSANRAVLQRDGNFVMYTADGHSVWSTHTNGKRATALVVQNDGNVVLRGPTGSIWSTNTWFVFPFAPYNVARGPSAWTQDQGVDISPTAGQCGDAAPLVAVAEGTITQEGGIQGFGPTTPVLSVTDGPLKGRLVYYGHTGADTVPVGAHVTLGQTISHVGCGIVGRSSGPHLEIGISAPGAPLMPAKYVTSREMLGYLTGAWASHTAP